MPKKSFPYAVPVPLWKSWPAGRGVAPRTESHQVSNIDLAPTLCSLAGCTMGPYPDGRARADGMSFAGLLRDGATAHHKQEILEQSAGTESLWRGLRTTPHNLGLWHYVEWSTGEEELYDVAADPYELKNLAGRASTAGTQALLAQRLVQLLSGQRPTTTPPSITP